MNLYKTPTRSISINDDELIFATWIGLWSMIGLMSLILGATMTMINTINNEPLSFWYVFFILILILGINLLFGKKKVVINKNTNLVTRTVKTLLFKLTKQININEFDKILIEHDTATGRYTHHDMHMNAKLNRARKVSLVKMSRKYNHITNYVTLADFYDKEGCNVFATSLTRHIDLECTDVTQ